MNLDSGFQSLMGFWIPSALSQPSNLRGSNSMIFPDSRHSTSKYVPDSGIRIYMAKTFLKPWDKSKKYSQKAKPNDSRPLLQSTPVRHRLSVLGFHANPCYNYYILPYFVNSIKPPRLLYLLVIGMPEKAIKKVPFRFWKIHYTFVTSPTFLIGITSRTNFFICF